CAATASASRSRTTRPRKAARATVAWSSSSTDRRRRSVVIHRGRSERIAPGLVSATRRRRRRGELDELCPAEAADDRRRDADFVVPERAIAEERDRRTQVAVLREERAARAKARVEAAHAGPRRLDEVDVEQRDVERPD